MKITSVDIFLLRHVGEEFSPFPFRPAVCRVNTDEGICGYGEAGISVGTGENGVAYMLKDLSQLVLGKDPMNNEVIWEDIHNVLRGHLSGGGVTVYSAMSALDTAMMDIKGKKLGVPIYVLLGGKHRDKLKCYLSQCHLGYLDDYRLQATIQQLADTCAKIQKDGYPAVKFNAVAFDEQAKPLPREMTTGPLEKTILDLAESRLAAVRERCGDQLGIILENLCGTDVTAAVQLERIARKYGVDYAVKKDRSASPPKYLIFFKARDADALTAAFSEYTQKKVKKADRSERPSVLAKLAQFKELLKNTVVDRSRRKELER